jgi:hypothetical protein
MPAIKDRTQLTAAQEIEAIGLVDEQNSARSPFKLMVDCRCSNAVDAIALGD